MIQCTFENEIVADPGLRHVTVGAIVINSEGKVLLVKRSAKFSRAGTWTVPGGFLDRDKTMEEAVLKELKEEAGHTGKIVALFHVNDNPGRPKEDRQNVDFIYLVEAGEGLFEENEETIEIKWFDKKSLPSEEDFAFDHRAVLLKYFEFREKPFALPLVGKI